MSRQWPRGGQYAETNGTAGEPVDMPAAKRLLELYDAWAAARSREEKVAAWQEILQIHAEQIYTIGIDAQVPQRSEEHTSELQSLMRISYAVFCLKTKYKDHKATPLETRN